MTLVFCPRRHAGPRRLPPRAVPRRHDAGLSLPQQPRDGELPPAGQRLQPRHCAPVQHRALRRRYARARGGGLTGSGLAPSPGTLWLAPSRNSNEPNPNPVCVLAAGQRLWVLALGLSPHRHALGVPEFKYVANMHGNEVRRQGGRQSIDKNQRTRCGVKVQCV